MTPKEKRKELRRIRREIEHALVWLVLGLAPGAELTQVDVDNVMQRLSDKESELEQLLLEIRYALGLRFDLAEVLDDGELDDRVIRQLLTCIEVELAARLTGEPKRILPFQLGAFRGGSAPATPSGYHHEYIMPEPPVTAAAAFGITLPDVPRR